MCVVSGCTTQCPYTQTHIQIKKILFIMRLYSMIMFYCPNVHVPRVTVATLCRMPPHLIIKVNFIFDIWLIIESACTQTNLYPIDVE